MLDMTIVGIYLLITLLLGIWVARGVTSSEEYKTGGRQYPSWVVFATLSASFIGGGFTIGLAEKTFLYGLVYVIAIWGFSLKELLVATLIAPRMKPFQNALTVGDIMSKAYGPRTKVITGIASVLVCGGIIGAQVCACGNILYTFLGLPTAWGSLIAAGIVVMYATYGGMKSVVAVDVLHFAVLIITLPLVLWFGIQDVGGFEKLTQSVPENYLSPVGAIGITPLLVLFASFFLGETLIPPYIQRLLIGKTIRATTKGTLWSGILSIPFFLLIGLIGLIALILDPNVAPNLALPQVIKMVMSSADSFLNSTATAMSNDILIPLGLHPKTQKQELIISRLVTLIIGCVAIIFALSSTSALDILLYSYQFWTPFILVPLLAAIFGLQSNDKVFVISAVVGVISVVWWNLAFPKSLIDGALEGVICGVLMNSLTFLLCHKLFSKKSEASVGAETESA